MSPQYKIGMTVSYVMPFSRDANKIRTGEITDIKYIYDNPVYIINYMRVQEQNIKGTNHEEI